MRGTLISKHIDIFAIACLLAAVGVASEVRGSGLIESAHVELAAFAAHQLEPVSTWFHLPQLCFLRE